jgi:predicted glycosyl hydrolase (DUF1957 family)
MITRDTSAPYARRRLDAHLAAVDRLHDAIRSGARPDRSDLPHDRSFPTLHCRDLSRTLLLS